MTLPALNAADFDAFFAEVYAGKTRFPWQRRLADQVCATGTWPDLLDLPTGTGKTAVLDIAVFAMAVDAFRPPNERKVPRRAILVVDRRTVVDQAHRRAHTLAHLLDRASSGSVLGRVAAALHGLRGDVATGAQGRRPRPLEVAYLRGAIPRDDGWARDPSQPMLGVSTVDQVGSRLLFRGYGVSPGMRSVHAGLLGNDVVYFLDEVHLSNPFAETLHAVRQWRETAPTKLPGRLHVVTMSATHRGHEAGTAFALHPADRAHPVLRRRLEAKKPASLEVVKVAGDESRRRAAFAERLAALAMASTTERHRRIAVVVNRVDTARAVHDAIAGVLKDPDRVVLVTGRMRPLDRMERERELTSVMAGTPRSPAQGVQVVVATQCIEAGADLDFDVMITECASLDALVQRFGRLDRLGDHGGARGVIAIRSDHTGDGDEDAVYGTARTETWNHLSGLTSALDFGLGGGVTAGAKDATRPVLEQAPVLLPGHIDLWCQTRPEPFPDPEVALWLHGPARGGPEVNIVWRSDLPTSADSEASRDLIEAILEASPPLRQEVLSVPLWAAEAWLSGATAESVADVDGAADQAEGDEGYLDRRWAIQWRGGDDGIKILSGASDRLRPGDTVVVPSTYGGLRAGTWAADAVEPVPDRGDEAQLRQRHRLVLRVDALVVALATEDQPGATLLQALAAALVEGPDGLAELDPEGAATFLAGPLIPTPNVDRFGSDDLVTLMVELLKRSPGTPAWLAPLLQGIELAPQIIGADVSRVLLVARKPVRPDAAENAGTATRADDDQPEVSSDDDRASRTGVKVSLVDHLAHVAAQAEAFSRSRGLPLPIATDVVLAAAWHDAGKADPRFQLWLVGGDEVALAALTAPLAKSAMKSGDRKRQRAARKRAKYPDGARHELASVAMLENADAILAEAHDPDLVLHLVASHHGWCRPYAPVEDPGAEVSIEWEHDGHQLHASSDHHLARCDASVVQRFWKVTQTYGWWGLAWLETLVRLADHRASEAEQDNTGGTR